MLSWLVITAAAVRGRLGLASAVSGLVSTLCTCLVRVNLAVSEFCKKLDNYLTN